MSETETKTEDKKRFSLVHGLDEDKMIEVHFELNSPFLDFLKEYISFFHSHESVEDLLREMVYSETERLFRDLIGIEGWESYIPKGSLNKKHSFLSIVSDQPKEEEENQTAA